MLLDFTKLNGLGNDFVVIDNMDGGLKLSPDQVATLCDRHFGIGADGVILVEQPREDGSDAFMNYINSDGTLAQMCGNGVRCFAKYLVDRKLVDADTENLTADTLAGPKAISYELEDGKMVRATVDMGRPILDPALVPTKLSANDVSDQGIPFVNDAIIESPWGDFHFTTVSMGNPHAICFIDDFNTLPDAIFDSDEKSLSSLNLDLIGPFFERNSAFPEKTNVEFAQVQPDHIDMRVYERGCGETLACGTGACATSVAATLTKRSGFDNDVHLLGGVLNIQWADDDHVFMTGTAQESFSGRVEIA